MDYAAQHTRIPFPNVYSSLLYKNRSYINMKRIRGEDLASAWKTLFDGSLQ
jgi:hypothetical protein